MGVGHDKGTPPDGEGMVERNEKHTFLVEFYEHQVSAHRKNTDTACNILSSGHMTTYNGNHNCNLTSGRFPHDHLQWKPHSGQKSDLRESLLWEDGVHTSMREKSRERMCCCFCCGLMGVCSRARGDHVKGTKNKESKRIDIHCPPSFSVVGRSSFWNTLVPLRPPTVGPLMPKSQRSFSSLSVSLLEILKLPVLKFTKRVIVINSHEEDNRAQGIFKEPPGMIVGFDSEAKPSFGLPPHRKNRTALIQVSTSEVCCIWRVSGLSTLPPTLNALMRNGDILKVAQGAGLERQTLDAEFGVTGEGFIDLHELATAYRCQPRSLQGLVGIFLEKYLKKEERCTDWEQNPLTQAQVDYAATDAYAALLVLQAMRRHLGDGADIPLPVERVITGPIREVTLPSPVTWGEKVPASPIINNDDGSLQKLTKVCINRGFTLKAEGFESAPGGFRAVFRMTTHARQFIFRSDKVHASIREAQNDAATCALEAMVNGMVDL